MSHALNSSWVGTRPTPYVGDWARAHGTVTNAMTTMMPAAESILGVDIGHLPAPCHLPALDGVQVIARVHAADLDEVGKPRLDVSALVGRARLQDGLLPVPCPGE